MPASDPLDFLAARAADPDASALLETESRSWSAAEFQREISELRSTWAPLPEGSSVGILLDDPSEVYLALFTAWSLGLVPCVPNPLLPAQQLNRCLELGGVCATIRELRSGPVPLPQHPVAPERTGHSLVLFTSGSSGAPKAVALRRSAVWHNACLAGQATELSRGDRIFFNVPPYAISGICHFLAVLFSGASAVIPRRGFAFGQSVLQALSASRCTGLGGSPAQLHLAFAGAGAAELPGSLAKVISSGDHLPASLIHRILRLRPTMRIFTMYGITEASGRVCVLPPGELPARAGSVGKPLPGFTITLRDDEGAEVPRGQTGEVCLSSGLLMLGYLGEQAAAGPMYRTGDLATLDEGDFLWLRGRKDSTFKSGGEKVSPMLVEDRLRESGFFSDLAVLGISDELLGMVPKAFVVPGDPEGFSLSEAIRALRPLLSPAEMPKHWEIVKEIPRTPTGKLRAAELRDRKEK